MKRLFAMITSSLFVGSLFAAALPDTAKETEETRNPIGCRDLGHSYDLKVLHLQPEASGTERQAMYFLFNKTNQVVNLYQMRDKDSIYSIYMNSTLQPRLWSVLSTSEPQMKYICTTPDSKSLFGKIVDCGSMLKVCEFNNVIYGLNNRGNFWIVRNNSRNGAVRDVVRYGIIPAT